MPLQIIRSDLTRMVCDAVVNPTDEQLSGSGGLDALFRRAAGSELDRACARIGFCAPGEAVLTKGYDLPARFIIHTVGPRWVDGSRGEAEALAACYRASLFLAEKRRFSSVAFPLIAAGTFGFPKTLALEIAVHEIRAFLREHEMDVTLVVFNRECYEISAERYANVQSFLDETFEDVFESYTYGDLPLGHWEEADATPLPSLGVPSFQTGSMPAVRPKGEKASRPKKRPTAQQSAQPNAAFRPDRALDESFSQMLLRKIDERGMKDADCYKKANVDRKLFSKIRKDPEYRPSKVTAIAFAVALELDLDETRELLMKAGYALSRSRRSDVIIEYFIRERIYDIFEINETLFAFDQPLLGA